MSFNLLIFTCLIYVVFLFGVAFAVEHRAGLGRMRWLRSPMVYTLSLSIYCTAWTFYGAVGYAARSGLEFVTIYLGPTLVFIGWWWILRKLVWIGRRHRITSIADLISSRFGKSNSLGVVVTLMAIIFVTPYIALQLQSVVQAFDLFSKSLNGGTSHPASGQTAIWVAAGLALFTILFGTRNLDAREQHTGIVIAIAVEAVVKLVALLAVGIFVVWGIGGGPSAVMAKIDITAIESWQLKPDRWAALIFLAGIAVLCLPRMFHVIVVENSDDRQLARASWAFPAYLLLMSLFIVPIAVLGLERLPADANRDMFMLTLPLSEGQVGLSLLAFLGGFSSATSMVIVEAIALATMVSNHIVIPTWLRLRRSGAISEDVRSLVLHARRLSIGLVLALGYGYYQISGGSSALAEIGLISFVGVAQFLPAMIGGIFWRGASRIGALAGLITGFALWAYCLFLPSFGTSYLSADLLLLGPWGLSWLRPGALFGSHAMDPLVHALFWSLLANTVVFCLGSILSFPNPLERLQGVAFVNVFDAPIGPQRWTRGAAEPEALLMMTQRIMGEDEAQAWFETAARAQGKRQSMLPDPTPAFLADLEERLAGSIGAATAHAVIAKLVGLETVSVEDLMGVARESAQLMEHSSQLETQREELGRTATALREANEKLTAISVQKDAFLSQISHELRTPMTSIRAFSEILAEGDLPTSLVARNGSIIRDEAVRLTRLLDDLLDLSMLESGKVQLRIEPCNLRDLVDRALLSTEKIGPERHVVVLRDILAEQIVLRTDGDRLTQVFINLLANARKYCDTSQPEIRISARKMRGNRLRIEVADNGKGIPKAAQSMIFEKFWRLPGEARAAGAGLGLAICRDIVRNLGGKIDYLPGQGGAAFRIILPLHPHGS